MQVAVTSHRVLMILIENAPNSPKGGNASGWSKTCQFDSSRSKRVYSFPLLVFT